MKRDEGKRKGRSNIAAAFNFTQHEDPMRAWRSG
jgi:hypothetical protein